MDRKRILKQLGELPHPITVGLTVFDDGCEFFILTSREGFDCTVGGAFPVNGPFKLSPTLHKDLMRVLSLQTAAYGLDELIEEHVTDASKRDALLEALAVIGEDAAKELFHLKLPATRSFYVFHNMGCGESALFSSRKAAYKYFLDYFTSEGSGLSWESMSDDDLIEWVKRIESWRDNGANKLPPREWMGAYSSPMDGTAGQAVFHRE